MSDMEFENELSWIRSSDFAPKELQALSTNEANPEPNSDDIPVYDSFRLREIEYGSTQTEVNSCIGDKLQRA